MVIQDYLVDLLKVHHQNLHPHPLLLFIIHFHLLLEQLLHLQFLLPLLPHSILLPLLLPQNDLHAYQILMAYMMNRYHLFQSLHEYLNLNLLLDFLMKLMQNVNDLTFQTHQGLYSLSDYLLLHSIFALLLHEKQLDLYNILDSRTYLCEQDEQKSCIQNLVELLIILHSNNLSELFLLNLYIFHMNLHFAQCILSEMK